MVVWEVGIHFSSLRRAILDGAADKQADDDAATIAATVEHLLDAVQMRLTNGKAQGSCSRSCQTMPCTVLLGRQRERAGAFTALLPRPPAAFLATVETGRLAALASWSFAPELRLEISDRMPSNSDRSQSGWPRCPPGSMGSLRSEQRQREAGMCLKRSVASVAWGVAMQFAAVAVAQSATDEVAELVNQLASQNPAPVISRFAIKKYPDGFDRKLQVPVYKARAELMRIGTEAFPFLIEQWDDPRYCLTTESALSGAKYNHSVGEECQVILFDQLQPYGVIQEPISPRRLHRPRYPRTFLKSAEDAKEWWENHKTKTLLELQVMVVEWVIAEEAKPSQDLTANELAYLNDFLKDLKLTQKAVTWGNYHTHDRESPYWSWDGKAHRGP